jgi:hypothetical protein
MVLGILLFSELLFPVSFLVVSESGILIALLSPSFEVIVLISSFKWFNLSFR